YCINKMKELKEILQNKREEFEQIWEKTKRDSDSNEPLPKRSRHDETFDTKANTFRLAAIYQFLNCELVLPDQILTSFISVGISSSSLSVYAITNTRQLQTKFCRFSFHKSMFQEKGQQG
ncbi:hypothetical protein L9F63_023393, partial [Diploptera punctata]